MTGTGTGPKNYPNSGTGTGTRTSLEGIKESREGEKWVPYLVEIEGIVMWSETKKRLLLPDFEVIFLPFPTSEKGEEEN